MTIDNKSRTQPTLDKLREEFIRRQQELIESLPELWDADGLHELLNERVQDLSAICREDVAPTLANFTREAGISAGTLHDRSKYITVQFSQEGVRAQPDSSMSCGYGINVRQVVTELAHAFEYLSAGGYDLYADLSRRHLCELVGADHMTLDWQGNTLHPALRYEKGVDQITTQDVQEIVGIVREGRSLVGKDAFDHRTPLS